MASLVRDGGIFHGRVMDFPDPHWAGTYNRDRKATTRPKFETEKDTSWEADYVSL